MQEQNNQVSQWLKTQALENAKWWARFNQLCYQIFFQTKDGEEWLRMAQQRFFYAPVAVPDKCMGFTFLNEGRNEFIRSITANAIQHMQKPNQDKTNTNRKRK